MRTRNYKDNLSSVLSYDIETNECQQLPELPYPVSGMATVKWGENVVIIGGADKDFKALNNVIIYNVKTGNSHMLPPMLRKRDVIGSKNVQFHIIFSSSKVSVSVSIQSRLIPSQIHWIMV